MSDAIITVENLGKCYRLQHQQQRQRYVALRDVITSQVKGLFSKRQPPTANRQAEEDFWALKGVSFEIKQGEVVGIIGRNGAGKSTLLKILSRITDPTKGRITLRGRIASLLEVGTGFHPELTGRENVFLNGAILGMTRAEVRGKFDEIVAFAEVEKFLDTPVKRYSSGMYVRLAFAVAAHLEPEILIVDEVLAVGDVTFQKKCLGKMQEVSTGGRTVLFVSHNLAAVTQLCSRGIVLSGGKVEVNDRVEAAVKSYLQTARSLSGTRLDERKDRKGSGQLRFHSVTMHDAEGQEVASPQCGRAARVRLHYRSNFSGEERDVDVAFNMRNDSGVVISAFANIPTGASRLRLRPQGYFECHWPKTVFRAGNYGCALFCAVDGEVCDWMQDAFTISVEDGDFFGTGALISRDHGDVLCEHRWNSAAV
jgi:lipopolysaccharide transport system ATP-binding protein